MWADGECCYSQLPPSSFLHQPTHTVIEKLASLNIQKKKKSGVGVKMSTVEWPNATHSNSQLWKYLSINSNGHLWHRYNWFCISMKSDVHIWWKIDDRLVAFLSASHFHFMCIFSGIWWNRFPTDPRMTLFFQQHLPQNVHDIINKRGTWRSLCGHSNYADCSSVY